MDALFRFLVDYEPAFYVVLGLLAVFAFRSVWQAWVGWRNAVFGLEKEIAFQQLRGAGTVFFIFVMMLLSVFCLVTFVAPIVPSQFFLATTTPDLLATPVGTLAPGETAASLAGPPPGTTGCIPGQLIISSLQAGQTIQGAVVLSGTVDIPNLGFYKYEYTQAGTENWAAIAAGRDPKREEELGTWNTSVLVPGDYLIRLVVIDNLGQELVPCIIPVRVIAP
jgi:hypothetical protein